MRCARVGSEALDIRSESVGGRLLVVDSPIRQLANSQGQPKHMAALLVYVGYYMPLLRSNSTFICANKVYAELSERTFAIQGGAHMFPRPDARSMPRRVASLLGHLEAISDIHFVYFVAFALYCQFDAISHASTRHAHMHDLYRRIRGHDKFQHICTRVYWGFVRASGFLVLVLGTK